LKVVLGELEDERESLANFLRATLEAEVTSDGNGVLVDSEKLPLQELKSAVNRFIYHRNLNNKYWVASEGSAVRVEKFGAKKSEKKRKKVTPPSTIKHGW
jgi:hypothetical protein